MLYPSSLIFSINHCLAEDIRKNFQVPVSVSEQLGDFRRIIDARLKSHCHSLIENTANMIVVEFADYLNKAEEVISTVS